ncbi:DEKNAAC100768 [Brettanomyces naardenensis]|uniref:DEKNAAC100768 n=1 Tax=Brettanomyces naardenensis TaxID=13370 RepID=A0A448YEM5_BRENA|nr:DEKNAAC100768 [Brettanomyces naardenensis]
MAQAEPAETDKKLQKTSPGKEVVQFLKRHSMDLLRHTDEHGSPTKRKGESPGKNSDQKEGSLVDGEEVAGNGQSRHSSFSPFSRLSFDVGVTENKNSHYRQSMEDVHTYVANFAERLDWGYFAIFDGHAGKQTARWCGSNLHNILYDDILSNDSVDLRENLNDAFQEADNRISQLNIAGSSGCTAAVAVLRWEEEIEEGKEENEGDEKPVAEEGEKKVANEEDEKEKEEESKVEESKDINTEETAAEEPKISDVSAESINESSRNSEEVSSVSAPFDFIPTNRHKRMLYTANVGDARIILSRSGIAKRLSYDHKSTDKWEQQRIVDSGGIILKSRVNGVLAVTRALGDCYMKSLVVGSPYTTSTELHSDDEFLILACDGLWDVCTDQEAVDMVRGIEDPKEASSVLCKYALKKMTTDNVTVMVVKFDTRVFAQRAE